MVLYIVISFSGALVQFNDFNSNSSIWFCRSSLFINACRSLSSLFVVVVVVVVLSVAVPAVLPFSVAFHHSSVDGPSELCTIIFWMSSIIRLQKFL